MSKINISLFYGTRPEIIKMAPLIKELRNDEKISLTVVNTGQHISISKDLEDIFEIKPDDTFDTLQEGQSLPSLFSKVFDAANEYLGNNKPDLVLVQGDTTTVMAVSLVCFYKKIKLGHVEAGLRSFNFDEPFPEEFNRRITTFSSFLHFAPTILAKENLISEKVPSNQVFVTGNTVVDACRYIINKYEYSGPVKNQILITAHRRENHGEGLRQICRAAKLVSREFPDITFKWPLHPNMVIQDLVKKELQSLTNVIFSSPLSYELLIKEIMLSKIIWSDSGGIQEEVPTLKKPILILRNTTERPEVLHSGFGKIVGTDPELILELTRELLTDSKAYQKMTCGENPFGDGRTATTIKNIIKDHFC